MILPAESALIGHTVREARICSEYDLTVNGLRHGSNVAVDDLLDERPKLGDTLLLIGFWSHIRELQSDMDDVVVPRPFCRLIEQVIRATLRSGRKQYLWRVRHRERRPGRPYR